MNGWKQCKLGDTGKVVTGKTPSKDNPGDWGNDVLFITPSDYKNYGKKAYSSMRQLSEIGTERQKNRLLPKCSVLVTCIGSDMGKSVVNALSCVTNQQINAIIPCKTVANEDYLYYITVDLYETLRSLGGDGTAVPILNKSDFENIDILLPPLAEQRAIAGVLSSIDDKIDLLHRQNKTLEGIAEALWRKMFMEDADPNWKKEKLGDYLKVQGGYAFKSADFKDVGQIGIIKITNISSGLVDIVNTQFVSREIIQTLDNKFKITTGSILIAMTGAEIGKIGIVEKTEKEIWLNQRVGVFHELKRYGNLLGFFALNSDEGQEHILSSATGSAQPNISATGIEDFEMPIVTDAMLNHFGISTQSLFDKICFNLSQIRTLSNLRDTLLPKLMSGEVRVKM